MASARFFKALVFGTCLTAAVTAADAGPEDAHETQAVPLTAAVHTSSRENAATSKPRTHQQRPDDDNASQAYQNLSMFGALVLGVLGLLWVRRHTAEL